MECLTDVFFQRIPIGLPPRVGPGFVDPRPSRWSSHLDVEEDPQNSGICEDVPKTNRECTGFVWEVSVSTFLFVCWNWLGTFVGCVMVFFLFRTFSDCVLVCWVSYLPTRDGCEERESKTVS